MRLFVKTARLVCFFAVISALVLSISGCSAHSFDSIVINSVRSSEGSSVSSRSYKNENTVKLASNESAGLYLHKDSGGIALTSVYSGKKWLSLPTFENSFASSFFARVTDGETVYILDSSAEIRSNKPSYELTDSGALVTYVLKNGNVSVTLPVSFSLSGASLSVSVDISSVTMSDGLTLLSVGILPYLGAVRYTADSSDYSAFGDYYLLPDGPGALMHTAVEDENTALTFSVYGKDYYEENVSVTLGAYGIVQGGSGLSATLTDGEENAVIRVFRAGNDDKNINRIYPEFIITPVGGEKGRVNIGDSYNGKIEVTYEVLSSENISYTDIASSVRQSLIREGYMPDSSCENEYPLTLSIVAGTDGKRSNVTADYQQIENLLGLLKGKGINEINAVLSGAFRGGLSASVAGKAKLLSALGTKNDLRTLLNFSQSQNFNVFAEANLLSAESSVYTEKGVSGEYKAEYRVNPLSPYIGEEGFTVKYFGTRGISESTNNILGFVEKNGFSGVSVADSSISCFEEKGSYDAYNSAVRSNFSAISSETKLMLSGTPVNLIKNADYLYNVPFETYVEETAYYSAVPFIAAVLHGTFVYSGEPSNSSSLTVINQLKAVEYGAVPHYSWNFNENSDKYYEYSLTEAVEFCLKAKSELGDLTSVRITGHEIISDGVTCTVFEGGVRVYVNYNNYSVIIGEVAVMPYDYLRIG